MLYLILLLVVASLGLLIAALTTANTLWAWISVLISVVAAGLLVLDWIQNRRRRSREAPATGRRPESRSPEPRSAESRSSGSRSAGPDAEEREHAFVPTMPPSPPVEAPQQQRPQQPEDSFPDAFEESFRDFDEPKLGEPPFGTGTYQVPAEPFEPITAIQEPVTAIQGPAVDPDTEPGEENTDATDILTVSELSDEVVVIDERPRYHLTSCAWLNGRPTMSLPVSEARELGFTPCALCRPDSTLAARRRARS